MPEKKEVAFCSKCNADVNLKQGFYKCIEDHQCFSDDPCPLDGRFPLKPVKQVHKEQATKSRTAS